MIRVNKTTWIWRGRNGTNVLKVYPIEDNCVRLSINFVRVHISEKFLKALKVSAELLDIKSMEFTAVDKELELLISIISDKISGKKEPKKLSIIVWPGGDYAFTRSAAKALKPFIPEGSIVTEL